MWKRAGASCGLRGFLIFALCDETFSLVSAMEPPADMERKDFYLGVSILNYSYWVLATAVGGLMGDLIPFDTTGLDFALTALFVVLFMEQWKKRENRFAGATGIVCAVVALVIFGADQMVIPAMIFMAVILLGGRKRVCS